MKKSLIIISSLFSIGALSGCGEEQQTVQHEHTFKTEWSNDETSHWKDASCEHTEFTKDRGNHIDKDENNVCDVCGYQMVTPEPPHTHTFDEDNWEKNQTSHWHKATCEHTELVKDLDDHDFGDDNICDTCGYELIVEKKHIVCFVSNGGSEVAPIEVIDGETISVPSEPTKEDYCFLGWYESHNFEGNQFNFESAITKNVTLYALWGAKVSFINYDGETYKENKIRVNSKIEKPENPSWNNAQFINWYEDENFEGEPFNFENVITKNINLYARYGHIIEIVNSEGQTISSMVHPVDLPLTSLTEPTKDYYDFDNWYSDKECTKQFEFGEKLTKDVKVYFKLTPKTYTITYVNAEGLTHANPSSYVYGVGLNAFLDPTENEQQDINKFYGWYLDEEFKVPALSISNELHENVKVYAKRGTYHTITYNGWPNGITNSNPTKITKYDQVTFDGSSIEAIEGLSNVKFKHDGNDVLGLINNDLDITIDVEFSSKKSTATLDPNGGKILGNEPFVYIDGNELAFGKKTIKVNKNDGSFNLYSDDVLKQMVSIDGRDGIFKGYYLDSSYTIPLSETEINSLESGSTIYAKFETVYEKNSNKNLPFIEQGYFSGAQGSGIRDVIYNLSVPKGYKKLNISFEVDSNGDHTVTLIDKTIKTNFVHLKTWGGTGGKFAVKESINVENITNLSFEYLYNGPLGNFDGYSISLTLGNNDDCLIKCIPSENEITADFYYYKTPVIPYNVLEKDYHTFNGWVDEDGNKVDLTSEWLKPVDSCTLKADWVYNGPQELIQQATELYNKYVNLFDSSDIEFEAKQISDDKDYIYTETLEPLLNKLAETEKDFDYHFGAYKDYVNKIMEDMWTLLGSVLIQKLSDLKDTIKAEHPGSIPAFYEKLDETFNAGKSVLQALKDDPEAQIECYKDVLKNYKAVINLYIF